MLRLTVSSLGKYEIIRKLAVGGMAELYLARQPGPEGFSKRVVIKRLLPGLTDDQTLITMFLDEARLAARLSHANIVQIYDLGSESGSYFIAMEYVRGRNLAELQNAEAERGEATPHGIVAYIISRICRGLHYAHTLTDQARRPLRVVHRDVSPNNVIVSFQGEVKLLDFGIAKAASHAAKTQAGLLKGKYAYMAPEQCKGELVDHRSDIFAAGIVLYELVCRRRLFRRTSDFATMRAVIEDPIPPPSAVYDEVPDELETVIMRALNRRPEERYQSAQEMQIELEQAMQANVWAVGPDQVADHMSGAFPDAEQELAQSTFEPMGPKAATRSEVPGRGRLESVKARELHADISDEVDLLSGAAALTSGSTDLTDEHDLPAFDDMDEDEEDDQTVIKPPDFDDIEVEPMGVEDDGAAMPGEDPLEQQELDPTDLWQSGAQSVPGLSDTVLNPEVTLQPGRDDRPLVRPHSDTVDLPFEAEPIQREPTEAMIEAGIEDETLTMPHEALSAPSSESAPRPPSSPARPPPSPPLAPRFPTEDLDPPTEDLKSPRRRAEQDKPPPPEELAQVPAATGNRVLIPLLIIAVAMVLIGGGLTAYILFSKRGQQADGGLVSLITEPPGATVYLNAEKRFETTPTALHGVPLDQENLLVLMLDGHKIWRKRFTLGGQNPQRTFTVKLVRTRTGGSGRLIVKVREAGAKVFLNGDYKGEAPLTVENVASGVNNMLVIKKPGFENKSLRVDALAPGERRRIVVGLRPANKGELKQGVKQRSRRSGGGGGGPIVIPRAKTTGLPPLGGQDVGERVPGR
jgi:serine/threonine protein kinase